MYKHSYQIPFSFAEIEAMSAAEVLAHYYAHPEYWTGCNCNPTSEALHARYRQVFGEFLEK